MAGDPILKDSGYLMGHIPKNKFHCSTTILDHSSFIQTQNVQIHWEEKKYVMS